jgi:hypothetical protein
VIGDLGHVRASATVNQTAVPAADWEVLDVNQRRLDELQKDPSTRYRDHAVIPIDSTLGDGDATGGPERVRRISLLMRRVEVHSPGVCSPRSSLSRENA